MLSRPWLVSMTEREGDLGGIDSWAAVTTEQSAFEEYGGQGTAKGYRRRFEGSR